MVRATLRFTTPVADLVIFLRWFHGYLEYPPHEDDIMQLPAGGSQNIELACNRVSYTDAAVVPRQNANPNFALGLHFVLGVRRLRSTREPHELSLPCVRSQLSLPMLLTQIALPF